MDTDGDGVGDRCYVTPVRLQYSAVAEAMVKEALEDNDAGMILLSFDNFPIKAYSDRTRGDVKLKLTNTVSSLCMRENYNSDIYHLQFTGTDVFDVGNPAVAWQVLPGSEDIVEIAPREQGRAIDVRAKAPGTALLSVTAEGYGTTVFPIEVSRGAISFVTVLANDPTYTGEAITPMMMVLSDNGLFLTEGVHYQVTFENNVRCGVARAEITDIGAGADPGDQAPRVEYFAIAPEVPEVSSLAAQAGEIRLSVADLSDTGASGYEARYRLKGNDEWASAPLRAGQDGAGDQGLGDRGVRGAGTRLRG